MPLKMRSRFTLTPVNMKYAILHIMLLSCQLLVAQESKLTEIAGTKCRMSPAPDFTPAVASADSLMVNGLARLSEAQPS
jgi:hypothetical protein